MLARCQIYGHRGHNWWGVLMSTGLPVARMAIAASVFLAACSSASAPPSATTPVPDPTSTRDLADTGGGSIRPIALAELPAISTAAIEATIVDIDGLARAVEGG